MHAITESATGICHICRSIGAARIGREDWRYRDGSTELGDHQALQPNAMEPPRPLDFHDHVITREETT